MNATAHFAQQAGSRASGEFGVALAEAFARRVGALAGRLGARRSAQRWARRAAFAVSRATSAGHVCVSLDRLAQRYDEAPDAVAEALSASGVVSDGAQDAAALRPLVLDAAGRLYLARYYEDERRLARAIVAHATAHVATDAGGKASLPDVGAGPGALDCADTALAARLTRFFGPPASGEVDWQRACAALSLSSRLTVVSGGPGTGKTTTVVGMLACLIDANPSLTIALAAPTGKAAQRMQEALLARASSLPAEIAERLPRASQTLHRLLGLGQGTRARYGRDNPLPYDLIVVDEASMIDLTLAAQLFDALAPQTRLVLLGDKDQLAAVEAGAVFAELSARPSFSAAGIARIAHSTGVDEARVRAALPRASEAADGTLRTSAFDDDPATSDDGLDWFEPLDSLDDRWAWTGLDEPDTATGASASDGPHRTDEGPLVSEVEAGAAPSHAVDPSALDNVPPEVQAESAPLVDCVVWLERNYRFGLDSAIGRLSMAIRRGDVDAALDALGAGADLGGSRAVQTDLFAAASPGSAEGEAAAVLDEDGGAGLSAKTLERLAHGFEPYVQALHAALAEPEPDCTPLFDALNAFRILCATRLGARGVQALNAHMAEHVRRAARAPLALGTNWFAGRAVMVARNDYTLGLFTGDIGIALPTRAGPLRVYFRTADGGTRAIAPAALPPHDTAFALTVHKSQGSEFDHAALVLPAAMNRVLTRELVYTAVTRARKTVRVIGAREVLADAIAAPTRRDSGLFARMQETLG